TTSLFVGSGMGPARFTPVSTVRFPIPPYSSAYAVDWSDTYVGYRYGTSFAEPFNMGRQQLPPVLVQVGAMEVLRYRTLMELHSMAGDCVLGLPIDDPLATVNIDTELDFIVAETAMQRMKMA
ncbi:MAG TPA: hypothetical protein PKM88_15165, partial [bacterium]|nr:hypothetical protein [bacterium]